MRLFSDLRIIVVAFVLMVLCIGAKQSEAAPAFARQTGFSCSTCHHQHFPILNSFGANFKATGYTAAGGQGMLEGDVLNMPVVLNASVVTKVRYQTTNGDNALYDERNRGQLQFPEEAALLLGGRAGEHIGFLLELQFVDPSAPAWASFKMPVVYEVGGVNLGVVPFTTDAAGPAYGLELLNTGVLRMQRSIEHRTETSAQQYIGTALPATGVTFYAHKGIGHVAYTMWSPEHGFTDASPLLNYFRAAITPNVAGFDLGIGAQVWSGDTKYTEDMTTEVVCMGVGAPDAACTVAGEEFMVTTAGFTEVSTDAIAFDAQAQGKIAGFPVGLYLTYARADKTTDATKPNLFNSSMTNDKKAVTALLEVGVIPSRLTLSLARRNGDRGSATYADQNATTIALNFNLTQNIMFQLNHSMYSGSYYSLTANNANKTGDRLTTFMLFAAF